MSRRLLAASFFLALALLWQILAWLGLWPDYVLPTPRQVAAFLFHAVASGALLEATWVTLRRLAAGFAIGVALGLPLGLVTAISRFARDTLGVLALGLQTLPSVCWVPLALIWFGQTEWAMLFVVVMGTLWSMIIATESGVRNLPPIYVRAARTMGSRGLHTLLFVVLPASLPWVVGGMKQAWAFAWRSLMAAEIYVTILTGFGLGALLHYGRELNAMDQVVGVMFCIIGFGLVADKVLFAPLESFLHRRWGTNKS